MFDPARPTMIHPDYMFGSDSRDKSQELKVTGTINATTGFSGASAVPVKGGQHMFPSRWGQHVLTRLSAAKFVLQTDLEESIEDVAGQNVIF